MKIAPLAAVAAAAASVAIVPQSATANGCGVPYDSGTYLVSTASDLRNLALLNCDVNANVRILADIDLGGSAYTPFGSINTRFAGTLDGGGHAISGLNIAAAGADGVGLLGATGGATIRNVRVSGTVAASGRRFVSLLVGDARDTTISNVRVSGTVEGQTEVGGVVGMLHGRSSITDASAGVTVTASNSLAGGIVGIVNANPPGEPQPSLTRVSSAGTITAATADSSSGGITSMLAGGSITQASSTATVRGSGVGGIAGSSQGTISDSYSTGAISTIGNDTYAGGIIGAGCSDVAAGISRSYFAGTLSAPSGVTGGIVAWLAMCIVSESTPGSSTADVWDTGTAGTAAGAGVGIGVTTSEMKEIDTFASRGWNIVNGWDAASPAIWGICPQVNDGRPFLRYTGAGSACVGPAPSPGPSPVTPAAPIRKLRTAFRLRNGVGTTSGTLPAGATRVTQTATTTTRPSSLAAAMAIESAKAKTARGRCTVTVVRNKKTKKVLRRTYRCSIRLTKGTWTITTTARGTAAVIAQGTRRVVVR